MHPVATHVSNQRSPDGARKPGIPSRHNARVAAVVKRSRDTRAGARCRGRLRHWLAERSGFTTKSVTRHNPDKYALMLHDVTSITRSAYALRSHITDASKCRAVGAPPSRAAPKLKLFSAA